MVFETPSWSGRDGRAPLVAELVRQLALVDFDILFHSARWRTYLALNATFMSIVDVDVREQVRVALADSEKSQISCVVWRWKRLADLLGYRLRPATGATFETLPTVLTATMRGLVIEALSDPGVFTTRSQAAPFGAVDVADWSLPALALGTVAS